MAVEARDVEAGGLRTRVLEAGRGLPGPAAVLLHGGAWGESAATTWQPVLEALGGRRHVVAPDLPGFGHSAKVRDFEDPLGFMARHVAAVVEVLGLAERDAGVDVVGLSMGGSVALGLAAGAAGPAPWLRSLVLVSAGGAPIAPDVRARLADFDGSRESMQAQVSLAFADPRWAADEEFVAARVETALLPGAWEAFASFGLRGPRAAPPPPPPDPASLRLPVLVVAGGRDAIKPPGWAEPFAAALPDGRLHVEPEAGHCPQLEATASFVSAVEAFLNRPRLGEAPPTPARSDMQVLYTARATSQGDGRNGTARTDDGRVDVVLAHPKEFGGSGEGTNPEQLFATGYSACFHSAVRMVARERKVDVTGSSVSAAVGIGPLGDRPGMGLEVALRVSLPGQDEATAREIVETAHQLCPYSNATRGNIDVDITVDTSSGTSSGNAPGDPSGGPVIMAGGVG